jgi:hypothetical protein
MIAIDPKAIAEKFTRYGGAFDRGAADSYYHRPRRPHYFVGATYHGTEVKQGLMTQEEIDAYHLGYDYNEAHGDKKDWG